LFIDSELDEASYESICKLITDKSFEKGSVIKKLGERTEAALYIIRSGKIESKKRDGSTNVFESGAFTGVETLTVDVKTGKNGKGDLTTVESDETLTALEDSVCGVLKLRSLRKVLNTVYLGTGNKDLVSKETRSEIKYSDLKRHTLLGAGTFGQVWLVSSTDSKGEKHPYALKVQSKYELIQDGQVSGCWLTWHGIYRKRRTYS
jgi:hypothetical protein